MKKIAESLLKRSAVFGVLGNHDRYSIGEVLENCGVKMLVNENAFIEKKEQRVYIAGVDDCHYYQSDDVGLAADEVPVNCCSIMVSHSPELYKEIQEAGFDLCLSGHTHGGQICLPGGITVVSGTTTPRQFYKGRWSYKNLQGYTSRGVGVSGVPARFFCPAEIAVITLKAGSN